jgi:hypothetical protein
VQASGERHPFVGGQPFGDEISASPDTGHRLGRNYEGFRAAIAIYGPVGAQLGPHGFVLPAAIARQKIA